MNLEFHNKLIKGGFNVEASSTEFKISLGFLERYPNAPSDYLNFLKSFTNISTTSDTSWFNSIDDFDKKSDNEFTWNAFELMSLEWSEDDLEELQRITQFWKHHIPILMSVENGYQFLAICLEDNKYGEIVHGQEPIFEDVSKICDNFMELVDLLENKSLQNFI